MKETTLLKNSLFLLYTFPAGALILQFVAMLIENHNLAIFALVTPLVFIPQVSFQFWSKYNIDLRKIVLHSTLSYIMVIATSLFMMI